MSLHWFPSFCVNFPEILRWKDLGCAATASSKAVGVAVGVRGGGGGAGAGASAASTSTDFAVMDLVEQRMAWIGSGATTMILCAQNDENINEMR